MNNDMSFCATTGSSESDEERENGNSVAFSTVNINPCSSLSQLIKNQAISPSSYMAILESR